MQQILFYVNKIRYSNLGHHTFFPYLGMSLGSWYVVAEIMS